MADDLKILISAGLNVNQTEVQIKKDLKTIEKDINSQANSAMRLNASLYIGESKKRIQEQLKQISQTLDVKFNASINASALKKSLSDASKTIKPTAENLTPKIFDASQLTKQGKKYFDISKNVLNEVTKYYQQHGAVKVDFSTLENSKRQLQGFIASVEYATGVIKKYNYEKAKVTTGSTARNRFVQTDLVNGIDNTSGSKYQATLNYLSQVDSKIATIKVNATQMSKALEPGTVYYDNYNKKLTETVTKINDIRNSNKVLSDEQKRNINQMISSLRNYTKVQQNRAYQPLIDNTAINSSIEKQKQSLMTLEQKWKNQGILTGEFKQKVDALKISLGQVWDNNGLNKYTASFRMVQQEATRLNTSLKSQRGGEKVAQQVQILTNRIDAFARANTRALPKFGAQLDALKVKLQSVTSGVGYQQVSREFQSLTTQVKALGLAGDSAATRIKNAFVKFSAWFGITGFIMKVVRGFKDIINNVKELDTAMISLQKVTNETEYTYSKFLDTASEKAKALGVTIKDFISSTAEFAKLGYNIVDSTKLSEAANVYAVVGEMNIEDATKSLVSTTAAFKNLGYNANNVMDIIDKFNIIGNNFSISSGQIGEALQRSASSLSNSNNTLEESIALITAANKVIQNSEIVGRVCRR